MQWTLKLLTTSLLLASTSGWANQAADSVAPEQSTGVEQNA